MKQTTGPVGIFRNTTLPIHIIGAGFSGLVTAYFLKKEGFDVKIHEKEIIGGKLQSQESEHGLIEQAANAYFTSPELDQLFDDLDLKPIYAKRKLKKWIWLGSPRKPFTLFIAIKIILSLFKKIDRRQLDHISMFEFFSPLTGKDFAKNQLSAIFGGVYAIDSETLSFRSVFKHKITATNYFQFFKELKKVKNSNYKPKSVSFRSGVKTLIDKLKNELKENIIMDEVQVLSPQKNWVICSDAQDAATLFKDSATSQLLREIEYTKLSSSTLFTKKEVPYLRKSFGVVIPPNQNLKTLGVVHNTGIFDMRSTAPDIFSYTLISRSSSEFKGSFQNEIKTLLSLDESNILSRSSKDWERAIPVYNNRRSKTILKLRQEFLAKENVIIFGNYIDGISLREITSHAKKLSKELNDNK
jgi:oxygen-dependent protoporphyrinogen oxidase